MKFTEISNTKLTESFKIKNPNAPVEESINEDISALQNELEQKYNLKSLFLADMGKRNAIELHSIIVNKEEQGSGTGSKVMQEIIAYADANGKIVVLDPGLLDKQHGTTSQSRLRKFYKRFGFIDNKGRNKNYEFRNLMIRYPQTNESINEATEMKISDLTISDAGMAIAQSVGGGSRTDAPLAVTKLPSGHVYLVNGYHRLVDAMNSGKDTVSVEYVPYEKVEILWKQEREQDIKYGKQFNESLNEGYKLQLERDTDMMVLNITDTKTGKRTEVRGKAGYETNGYDANDKLHQLLDKISKSANISELMNGEVVGINPNHPAGPSAKTATTTAFNESLDNPYPYKFTGPNTDNTYFAKAQTPNGELVMEFDGGYDDFNIDFAVGNSMGKTEAGDAFRVFATVVAMMNKWISVVGIEHVEEFSFAANKEEHAADGRARLYARFAKKLAAQLGWSLQQSSTGNNSTEFFNLKNPKPVERPDGYFDAIEDGKLGPNGEIPAYYSESVVEAEDTLTLPKIKVGDEVMVGKFKNRKAEVKGFSKDDHNQPVLNTTKGDQKLFKPRISKLMKSESAGVGRVVKGVNTTVDVGVDEIIKQVKKYGNAVDRDGKPKKNLR